MKIADEPFTIVILGRWNPFVFTPEWVKQFLRQGDDPVTLAFPLGDPSAPVRLDFDNHFIYARNDQLILQPKRLLGFCSIEETKALAIKIIELLPHTPISACGVNFRLIEDESPESIYNAYSFGDAKKMPADTYSLQKTRINREYQLSGDWRLNLAIEYTPDQARIEFNFHIDVLGATSLASHLSARAISERFSEIQVFISTAYDLTIDAIDQPEQELLSHEDTRH